jgi:hypothetical protein
LAFAGLGLGIGVRWFGFGDDRFHSGLAFPLPPCSLFLRLEGLWLRVQGLGFRVKGCELNVDG